MFHGLVLSDGSFCAAVKLARESAYFHEESAGVAQLGRFVAELQIAADNAGACDRIAIGKQANVLEEHPPIWLHISSGLHNHNNGVRLSGAVGLQGLV